MNNLFVATTGCEVGSGAGSGLRNLARDILLYSDSALLSMGCLLVISLAPITLWSADNRLEHGLYSSLARKPSAGIPGQQMHLDPGREKACPLPPLTLSPQLSHHLQATHHRYKGSVLYCTW